MTEPRERWYKPNMLYNIHYKPPTPKEPQRFKVVTKKFNPSVCTCGEHGCEPRYRMEREVVWLKKETEGEIGRDVKKVIEDKKEVITDAGMKKEIDDEIGKDVKEMSQDQKEEKEVVKVVGMKKEIDGEIGRNVKELIQEQREVVTGEEMKKEIDGEIGKDVKEMIEEKKEEKEVITDVGMKKEINDEIGNYDKEMTQYQKEEKEVVKDVGMKKEIDGEIGKDLKEVILDKIEEKEVTTDTGMCIEIDVSVDDIVGDIQDFDDEIVMKCGSQAEPTKPEDDVNDAVYEFEAIDVDNEDCGAAFGILNVFCCSELHTTWAE